MAQTPQVRTTFKGLYWPESKALPATYLGPSTGLGVAQASTP